MKEECKQVLERAYLFLDGEVLSESERLEIQVHLEECAPCLERVGFEREMHVLIHRLQGTCRCPDGLKNRILDLIREV